MKKILPFIGLAAVCAGSLYAQDKPKDEKPKEAATEARSFTFKSGFETGQSLRYHTDQSLIMRFPGNKEEPTRGLTGGINATLRYLVREAKPDGEAQVAYLFEETKVTDNERSIRILPKEPDDTPRVVTMNNLLHILKMKDESKPKGKAEIPGMSADDAGQFLQIHFIPLPSKTVKIGDSWTVNYPRVNGKEVSEKSEKKPDSKKADDKNKEPEEPKAEITLLGTEMREGREFLRVKHVLTIPFEAYTDAEGRMLPDKKKSGNKMTYQMIYTQIASILPTTGLLIRAEGKVEGQIKFEGSIAKQLPGDTMTIEGEFITGRMKDKE